MKLFNRTNRAYSVLYINVPNTLQKSVVTSRLRIRQSVDIIIISNYRQRFLNCVAYCPGFLQNTLTVFCSLVWWVDFMSGLVVESFQPPSLLKWVCFCVLNGLADHLRNKSVYLENWTRDSNLRLLETVLVGFQEARVQVKKKYQNYIHKKTQ